MGIGNDIIEVARIRHAIDRYQSRFLDRIFTKKEQDYCLKHKEAAYRFAGRFAAKEAIVKALGIGFRNGISWLDIEILNDNYGKPYVVLSKELQELFNKPKIEISISHCRDYATAVAYVGNCGGSGPNE
jgi:holo-[acyl-carrier protein] synthase